MFLHATGGDINCTYLGEWSDIMPREVIGKVYLAVQPLPASPWMDGSVSVDVVEPGVLVQLPMGVGEVHGGGHEESRGQYYQAP